MSKLTAEQAEIVTSKSRKLVVAARAGSGKTYTLVEYARQNPRVRML
ncbi:UvrD-helicase domain-containing protein, partial [Streptomyces sp. G35A]